MESNRNALVQQIESLNRELDEVDKDKIRFSIDAGLIDRLGRELVGKQETAVSELVKNAYDADATEVIITFSNSDTKGGTLTIDDNGRGMDMDSLRNGFMRISSTDKVHSPVSPKFNRKRAGRKGIGRFATHRLGEKLTITTQTKEGDKALQLTINWEDYAIDRELEWIQLLPKIFLTGNNVKSKAMHFTTQPILRDFDHFLDLLGQSENLELTRDRDHLRQADLQKLNESLEFPARLFGVKSQQPSFAVINAFYYIARAAQFLSVRKSMGAKQLPAIALNKDRIRQYDALTADEKYFFLLESLWCFMDWDVAFDVRSFWDQKFYLELAAHPVGKMVAVADRDLKRAGKINAPSQTAFAEIFQSFGFLDLVWDEKLEKKPTRYQFPYHSAAITAVGKIWTGQSIPSAVKNTLIHALRNTMAACPPISSGSASWDCTSARSSCTCSILGRAGSSPYWFWKSSRARRWAKNSSCFGLLGRRRGSMKIGD